VLDAALSHAGDRKVFAAYLHSASAHEIAELRLGKKTEQLYAQAEKLHRQLDRYAYGPPPVRFTDEDVDQARAAGVLIEFERARPIIVDRSLYRELVKGAVKRTHAELEAKATAVAKEKQAALVSKQPADPVAVAKRERDVRLRELADQAHGANVDLGVSLMHQLAAVDPDDMDVARFFVLCGSPHRTNYADSPTMPSAPRWPFDGSDWQQSAPLAIKQKSGRDTADASGRRIECVRRRRANEAKHKSGETCGDAAENRERRSCHFGPAPRSWRCVRPWSTLLCAWGESSGAKSELQLEPDGWLVQRFAEDLAQLREAVSDGSGVGVERSSSSRRAAVVLKPGEEGLAEAFACSRSEVVQRRKVALDQRFDQRSITTE
jgi:hypothetical protein